MKDRKGIRKGLVFGIILALVAMTFAQVPMNVSAEECSAEPCIPEDNNDAWVPADDGWSTEGTGTYFEITDSEYQNIVLTSSENVHVFLVSLPKTISYYIEPESSVATTAVAIVGLLQNQIYYRYEDGIEKEQFVTDESGKYTYTQDITTHHHVTIQEDRSTLYIYSDYTFTSNLYNTLYIMANNVVIDGNGYTLYGPGYYTGITVNGRTDVTIKNLNIKSFGVGIELGFSSNVKILDNVISNIIGFGISFYESTDSTISGNTIKNIGYYGIYIQHNCHNTVISNNHVSHNYRGVILFQSNYCTVTDNTISYHTNIGLYPIMCNYALISGNTVDSNSWVGVFINWGFGHTIKFNTIINNNRGIYLSLDKNEIITDNLIVYNTIGIYLYSSTGNTIERNTFQINNNGIYSQSVYSPNTIHDNFFTGNINGINYYQSGDSIITQNTFTGGSNGILLGYNGYRNTIHENTFTVVGTGINIQSWSYYNDIKKNTFTSCTNGISTSNWYSGRNVISENTIHGNTHGIKLYNSGGAQDVFSENTISYNSYGIWIFGSSGNYFFNNNIFHNTVQLEIDGSTLTWNNGHGVGNHWSDYTGYDTNGDGIGDTNLPHNGVEYHPLIYPWTGPPVNDPPIAVAGGPYSTYEANPITFDGSDSWDPEMARLYYRWDFNNDGVWDTSYSKVTTATYTWEDDYSGVVALQVTDGELTEIGYASVTVNNAPPYVWITSIVQPFPTFILVGDELTFTGTFYEYSSEDTHTIEWDFGDGIGYSSNLITTYAYDSPATYTVTLTVTDDDGGVGSDSEQITIFTPALAIQEIGSVVESMVVSDGIANSMVSKLEGAIASLNKENEIPAENQLEAFINEVEAQRGKELTNAQSDELIEYALRIINSLNS
ncbi:MAG: right-handed parallel beta-helix repeat-containing protein [Thermoplasmata archaeon]|nr:MAG: right-handed parallel beta-helix repeat-containing protein [Thermoplasmata archaeon]